MASSRPGVNFHKYFDGIFVVTKNEVFRVYLWLYEGASEYVGEYLNSIPGAIRKLSSMEREALRRRDLPVTFDIPFLYKLLQLACGLPDDTNPIWFNPATPQELASLEHTLYLIKTKRNVLCHKPQAMMHITREELDSHLNELSQFCKLILKEAGQKANRPTNEVNDAVAKMERAFDDIKTKPLPSGMTAQKFAVLSREEMTKNHTPSPSTERFIVPQMRSKGKSGSYERHLHMFPLWRCDDGSSPRTVVLTGETGTGKTSICGFIFDSWISNSNQIIDLLEFDIVIPVQMSSIFTRDLTDFLRLQLKDTVTLCNREEIPSFFRSLRILWLIDGFEEATKDATKLLEGILSGTSTSHSHFITIHPQHIQELISDFSLSKDLICEVSLLGLGVEGIQRFLEMSLNGIEVKTFQTDVESLGNHLLQELNNPLKMKLMVELWQEGKLSKESGASVYELYEAITEAHKEKIIEKLRRETKLKDRDINERLQSWVNLLCKIAFTMTVDTELVKISKNSQEQMEKEAMSLIYPKDCMSVFLQSETLDDVISYSFVHGTQQVYLAAKYVSHFIQRNGVLPSELKRLFKRKISLQDRQSHHFFYLMLLQVVSCVAHAENVDRSVAKELVQLLSTFEKHFNVYEVVQHAAYNPIFAEEVSKFKGRKWRVVDRYVKAAISLLQFTVPSHIEIELDKDPKDLTDLPTLMNILCKIDLIMHLKLFFHYFRTDCVDVSDPYLSDICSADAKCHIRNFAGSLSLIGVESLSKMKELRRMNVKVCSNEILHQILCNLKYLQDLEHLLLSLTMPVVTVPHLNSIQVRVKDLYVSLPSMDESKVNETANSIASISKHYESIILFNISADSAVQFVQILQERNIQVNMIQRQLGCHPDREIDSFIVNYGAIPLNQTMLSFHNQWHNTYVESFEDDLGIKRIQLVTSDISKENVMYVEENSLTALKISKFR